MNEMKHMRDIHWTNRLAETRSLGGELSAAPISANVPMSDGGWPGRISGARAPRRRASQQGKPGAAVFYGTWC